MNINKEETQDREMLTKMIYAEFKTFNLTKRQYSRLINRSIASIDRDRACSRGASYRKEGHNKVYYPIQEVVSYLLNVQKTLDSLS